MPGGPRLLAITPPQGPCPVELLGVWRQAGADDVTVLLRRPGATVAAQLADPDLRALAEAAGDAGLSVLASCAPDDVAGMSAAAAAGLAGVQLRGDPRPAAIATARGAGLSCVGASVHGPPDLAVVRAADWVALAPVFAPATPDPRGRIKTPIGLEAVRAWAEPGAFVVALGGIDATTAALAVRAGARGVASIRSFFGPPRQVADNVGALVRALHGR